MEEGAAPPEGRIGKDDEIAEMLNTQAREREDRKAKKRKKEAFIKERNEQINKNNERMKELREQIKKIMREKG